MALFSLAKQLPSPIGRDSSSHSPVQRRKVVLAGGEIDYENPKNIDATLFRQLVMEGKWDAVVYLYQKEKQFHQMYINRRWTALHVAVNTGKEDVVANLVDAVLHHEGNERLACKDDEGATPLHLAARRGLTKICERIVGSEGERKSLIQERDNNGETPLFWAAQDGRIETFKYLDRVVPKGLSFRMTEKNDSVLHVAIRREFFDLATFIIRCYPALSAERNTDHVTPLEVLATKLSAFKSGMNLSWWKQILYHWISLDQSKIKSVLDRSEDFRNKEKEQHQVSIQLDPPVLQTSLDSENADRARYTPVPPNWVPCIQFVYYFRKLVFRCLCLSRLGITEVENEQLGPPVLQTSLDSEDAHRARYTLFPPNWVPFVRFVYYILKLISSVFSLSRLGISGVDLKAIEEMKEKHFWGRMLLDEFMKTRYVSYVGSYGAKPTTEEDILSPDPSNNTDRDQEQEKKETTFLAAAKCCVAEIMKELNTKIPSAPEDIDKEGLLLVAMKKIKHEIESVEKTDKQETAYLAAARTGIVEIVSELQNGIPSVIHGTTSKKENVLLVAVKNRQPLVVKELKENLAQELLNGLIYETDNMNNNVLHLAAGAVRGNEKSWQIAGAAMQMMWDIKWYQYINELVPKHFAFRVNKDGKTPGEIFKQQHEELVKESSEWMKETSNSCSVVAALIAGVSFATASTVPGGTENGKPALEGQPAFDAFAIASLVGLCFSVTALIMFLAILTSRKQIEDFKKSLPMKLLIGLSSLFLSIASMLFAFCAGHFFVLKDKYKSILFPIYIATCLPVSFFAVVQFPLYADLVKAIFKKMPPPSGKGVQL